MPSRFSETFPAGWPLAVAAVTAGLAGVAWYRHADPTPAAGDVLVVRGRGAPAARSVSPTPVAPVRIDRPTGPIVERLRVAYPLLSDVSVRCVGDRCVLDARVLPLTRQADLDKRQEMLLGGLAVALSAGGYAMQMPFRFDEVDDNSFHLKASLVRVP